MSRDRNDHGRFSDRIPLDRVLEVFDAREDPARPLTAGDVGDELGCSRRTAYDKLETLAERGDLETRKVGARGRVWWVSMDTGAAADGERDPLFDLPTFSGKGPTDVAANTDEYLADAIAGGSDDDATSDT